MTRDEKAAAVKELHDKFAKAKFAVAATYGKLDAATAIGMRKKFRDAKVEYKVVKNTLATLAAKGTSAEGLADVFSGPTAILFGYADPVTPAKVLAEVLRDTAEKLSVKAGVVEGQRTDVAGLKALATLPGLTELRAMLLGVISAPASRLARLLATPGQQLARALDARREQLEKQGPVQPN
jgi:large subunit ribosomal protein L10